MDFSQRLFHQEDDISFDSIACERDIYNCFRLILGRYPNRTEWANHCTHVGLPLAWVTANFVDSVEYQTFRDGRLKPEFAQLPGFALYASPEDMDISRHVLEQKEYESHVTRVFAERLSEGMTVLDIGANIGYFTFMAAARVGSSGRVWAIEPNRKNVAFLLATRARNAFSNVEIIQAAASDRWEILCLLLDTPSTNATAVEASGVEPAHFAEPVMALPLSACLPRSGRIDIIKIDVEGAEGKALHGMLDLLERDLPVVFSEFTPSTLPALSGMSPGEYLDLFTTRRYRLAVLEKSGPRFIGAAALLEHANAVAADGHIDILAEPVQRS